MSEAFRTKVVRSTAVNFGVSLILKVALLTQSILYARIFHPVELGQVSTALLAVSFVLLFGEMGYNESIIRESKEPERVMNTALTLAFVVGIALFGTLLLIAPVAATLFHRPELKSYIRFMAFLAFGNALVLPNMFWIRDFRFGIAKIAAFTDLIVATLTTLLLWHFTTAGIWSLFLGRLAGFVGNYGMIWALAPYRPAFRFERAYVSSLYRFGWPLLISSVCNFLIFQGDDILVRYFWGDANLAYYMLAFALPFYLKEFTDILIASLLPTYSFLRESSERIVSAFVTADRYLTMTIVPCGIALVALARPLIEIVYGPKWLPAITPLRFLALGFSLQMMGGYSWGILAMARGRTKYLMYVKLWVVIYLATVGTYLIRRFGIVGGGYYAVTQTILTVGIVRCWILHRELGSLSFWKNSLRPVAAAILPSLLVGVIAAPWITNLATLAIAAACYFAIYAGLLHLLDPNIVRDLKDILRLLRQRGGEASALTMEKPIE